MTAISTRVISRSTCGPRPPLVQLDNQYPSLSARSPDSIRRSAPPARSASSAPPPLSAMGARSPSPPTSRSSGACATSPPRAPDAPRSASASPSNIASPTMPRSRGASLAISACARTSSTPGVTRPSSTSKCSRRAEPRDYAGFKPFGALAVRCAACACVLVYRSMAQEEPKSIIAVEVERPSRPAIWLDTSALINITKARSGRLKHEADHKRVTEIDRVVTEKVRAGRLLSIDSEQRNEAWKSGWDDFVETLESLSVGTSMRPLLSVQNAQFEVAMMAYLQGASSMRVPLEVFFDEDPVKATDEVRRRRMSIT